MQTRIGVIGVGGFCANYHLPHLLSRTDVEITAVCDEDAERLQALDDRLADAARFTDYRPLLDLDLDAILISTPNIYHFDQCQAALARNLHVLVDKPLTMTSQEAAALVESSHARDRILMTAYTRHFMASAQKVRGHIASGASPQAITAVQRKNIDDRSPEHGGILHSRAVHILDLVPWLLQRPIIGVEGRVDYGPEGYETLVDVRLAFKDGPSAHLLCISGDGEYQDEISVYGREQSFRIEKERLYAMGRRGLWSPVDVSQMGASHSDAGPLPDGGNSTDHFIDAVQGKVAAIDSPTALDGQDGLQALRVVEAIKEAGQSGRFVDIPEE